MANKVKAILKEVLQDIRPSKQELSDIKKTLTDNLDIIKSNIRKNKINADIFVGGSAAKGTMLKKDGYEVDIFIRFDKKYKDSILSTIAAKLLQGIRAERVHGSRDYFKAKVSDNLLFEFVPVRRVRSPREAENITDLSYSHVNYIKKKIKSEKILDEIRLAKAFSHANGTYGAESYVQGFSGYGLELLVYHYRGFLKFLKAMVKIKPEKKEIIDMEKQYKNRASVLMDLNSAKLQSPIVLIDPTYKQRNVLAALSAETFEKFQQSAKDFLKKPRKEFFEQEPINLGKIKADADARSYEYVLLQIETDRQAGDIAGSKLLKFYRHFVFEAGKLFNIRSHGFEYKKTQTARVFLVGEPRPFILISGPRVDQEKHTRRFRNIYRNVQVKNGKLYAKIKPNMNLETFVKKWAAKYRQKIVEMNITNLKILS